MSIKYAVLGLLAERPCHGYGVRARFEEHAGDLLDIGSGRVYDVLARLEVDGLVLRATERRGRRTRKVYSISVAGRCELVAWAHREPPPLAGPRDLLLRLLAVASDDHAVSSIVRTWERRERRMLEALERHTPGTPVLEVLRRLAGAD
ncbi:MAG: PadR family transcriptional regulator [Candidatus Binatia bacterium]|nr:PadR family transcriptional regulator [Candidatus Binatia bacterium]